MPDNLIHPPSYYSITAAYPGLPGIYGLLAGPGLCFTSALAGLWFGKAADKMNRVRLLGMAIIAWSLTTITAGSVNSLAVFALMRVMIGTFTAASEPLIFSLIPDFIPKDKMPTANSAIKASMYAGHALSGLSVIAISMLGWRGCCLAMGALGIFVGA